MNRMVLALAALALLLGGVGQAKADFAVDCGYADSRNGTPGSNFPDLTTNNAQFMIDPSLGIDSALIRIRNTGTTSITITAVLVNGFFNGQDTTTGVGGFGTVTPLAWTFPLTLMAGQSAIFGQTVAWNFDGSDSNHPNDFIPSGAIPMIHLTVDGTSYTASDSMQILNTGGVDIAGLGLNESHDWANCATFPSAVPEPSSLTLLGLGTLSLFGYGRWRKRTAA